MTGQFSLKRILQILFLITLLYQKSEAQSTKNVKAVYKSEETRQLQIGDVLPDVILQNVHNYKEKSLKLSSLQGRYVILDFFASWCKGCLDAFTKMHKYQDEYGDKLQVLLIDAATSKDTEEKIENLFKIRKKTTGYDVTLPYTIGDKMISPFFKYRFLPHYVWVNPDGSIYGITSAEEATNDNVKAFVNGLSPKLRTKKDMMDYQRDKPLFVNNNGGYGDEFGYRSIFTKYLEGLGAAAGRDIDNDNKTTRLYYTNYSFPEIIQSAYSSVTNLQNNLILIECKDSLKIANLLLSPNTNDNRFCYEIILPAATELEVKEYMKQDISRYFKIKLKKEERVGKAWVITDKSAISSLNTKFEHYTANMDTLLGVRYVHDASLPFTVAILNRFTKIPLICEITRPFKIDIEIPNTVNSEKDLIDYMRYIGFDIQQQDRKLQFTVVTDAISPENIESK